MSGLAEATQASRDAQVVQKASGRSHSRRKVLGIQIGAFIVIVGLWQAAMSLKIIPRIVLPTPIGIAERLWLDVVNIFTGGYMLSNTLVTFNEAVIGFILSIVIGIVLGAIASEFFIARTILMPYIIAFNSTPRIAFAPLFLIWFGFGQMSKIVMSVAIATFPVIIGTIAGLGATDRMTIRLMRAYGGTRWQTLAKVRAYAALPHVFAGIETAVVFALLGAVVGEFTGGNAGLGYIIVVAQEALQLDQAFSAIIILSLLGLAMHRLVIVVRNRIVYWKGEV